MTSEIQIENTNLSSYFNPVVMNAHVYYFHVSGNLCYESIEL